MSASTAEVWGTRLRPYGIDILVGGVRVMSRTFYAGSLTEAREMALAWANSNGRYKGVVTVQ